MTDAGPYWGNSNLPPPQEGERAINALVREIDALRAENERLRAALTEIADLELEGDASLADAMTIADEALNPPPESEA